VTAIPKVARPAHRKGKLSERNKFVRSVVREVVGFSPYERRVLELLRNGKVRPSFRPFCSDECLTHGSLIGQKGQETDKEEGGLYFWTVALWA
jgi:Ribosomal protein L36e